MNTKQIADRFAEELSALSSKWSIGIDGGALFVMEPEDHPIAYECDGDSNLRRV